MVTQVPLAEGVFTWPTESPQLIGSKCEVCGIVTFPAQDSCPRCASESMLEHLLARRGTLWAFTTQSFPPPAPPYAGPVGTAFEPFSVGFVDLGDVKVEARLTEPDVAKLTPGMVVELTVVPFATNESGDEVLTFAFAPVEGS
jgi:uncharacterized OB-fold protein